MDLYKTTLKGIMQTDINIVWQLKAIPFEKVLHYYHIGTPDHRGRQFKVMCPFHSETQPSFTIDPEKNLAYCFGCSRGWDTIKFIREQEGGCRFYKALEVLASIGGYDLPEGLFKEISQTFGGVWGDPKEMQRVYAARRQEEWQRLAGLMADEVLNLYQRYPGWRDFHKSIEWIWEDYNAIMLKNLTVDTFDNLKDWFKESKRFIRKEGPRWKELGRFKRKLWEERVGRLR